MAAFLPQGSARRFCAPVLLAGLVASTGPLLAQAPGTCVVAIIDQGTAVQSKGAMRVGACFGPGQDIVSPPGTTVKVVTPLGDSIAVSGTLRIKAQSPAGQTFWVRSGTAAFNVVAKHLSFFNVEGQNGNRTFQAAVRGTAFAMTVDEGKSVTLQPQTGTIQVTRAVKLGITGGERSEGKRDVAAAKAAAAGGQDGRARQALTPGRNDLLASAYAGKTELVTGGGDAIDYALDEDDVVSFETIGECLDYFRTSNPGAEGYRNLGDCYLEGDEPAQAIAQYNKALAADLRQYSGGLHPDVADDYRSLADAYSFTDPRQAVGTLRKAMDIDRQLYGDEPDPDVSEDHRALADYYLLLEQPAQAIAELEQALAVDQQLYPDGTDYDLATDYRSLGEAHILAAIAPGGDPRHLAVAIKAFGQALAIDRRLYGNDADPDLAEDHRGLGYAYLLADDPSHAFGSFQQALAMGFRVVGLSYDGNPAVVHLDDLDLDSDEVDADVVEGMYEDAITLSDIADAQGHHDQAEAFLALADDLAAKLEGE